jgi:hypothetical protein
MLVMIKQNCPGCTRENTIRVAGGWWLVAGGWWLVAGGWWLVGGWWVARGESFLK